MREDSHRGDNVVWLYCRGSNICRVVFASLSQVPPAILPVVQADVGIDLVAYHQHVLLRQSHVVEHHTEKCRRRLADDHRLADVEGAVEID